MRFLAEAARRYDVFHFNFGSTLLPGWGLPVAVDELPLLRRLGKRVIATFQGDDARPPQAWSVPPAPAELEGFDRRRRNARERMLRYADHVFYLNPDMRRWLPGASFCAYASFDPRAVEPVPPRTEGELTIIHAPSHRGTKGTDVVLAAVDRVRAAGIPVRLDLVEGVGRDEALARCARADIAIDQVRVGWYGGFAVEAMSLGKPVLCYVKDSEPGDNPFGDELPLVRTTAATLADDLTALLADAPRRTGDRRRGTPIRRAPPRPSQRRPVRAGRRALIRLPTLRRHRHIIRGVLIGLVALASLLGAGVSAAKTKAPGAGRRLSDVRRATA